MSSTGPASTERYRLKHGELPQKMADLGEFLPSIPLDPYDGQPLRLKVEDGELVLYSVGKNAADDGGSDLEGRGEPDIAVRLK
jgi:hypothetical protein